MKSFINRRNKKDCERKKVLKKVLKLTSTPSSGKSLLPFFQQSVVLDVGRCDHCPRCRERGVDGAATCIGDVCPRRDSRP